MALEKLSITIDGKLKHEFLQCVLARYPELEDGIVQLIRGYVEHQKAAPTQEQIKLKVQDVYKGDPGTSLSSRDIEKIFLNKTDAEIEANRLA